MDTQTLNGIQSIPVSQLTANPWNRRHFTDKALKELIASVANGGIKEPLIVRPLASHASTAYQIASGNRRWLAAKEAGLKEVPCLVLSLSDEEVQDMNLVTNIQREDIPLLQRAQMIQQRMIAGRLTQEQMATRLGKERSWVAKILSLLDIHPDAQQHLADTPLAFRPLLAMKALPPEHQVELARKIKQGELDPQAVERHARSMAKPEEPDPLAATWSKAAEKLGQDPLWKIAYKGDYHWQIDLSAAKSAESLHAWFQQMADLFGPPGAAQAKEEDHGA